ncbi:CaiB/BaiF CoA-transferase family protein [Paralimibaculum aggregatum]|uniref:CaiB/BaiF CoA-transferase family protein n=1 Tax=Paralimibaculum aggregatum TaxID=3036245 RepID=A0ABQ6LFE6_9RHOB|nr:CaiB/BaiF CoA-transferase family protein [Limibaculum sp. NKW23]GMG82054.1 CaiB/BaiF CoA-transferase family protein [Limibaculum sp. NKW23]
MTSPLAGLRVVELARILAGPWIGQTLADLGADVIKVEAPGGDDTRGWGPPFVEREVDGRPDRSAAYFHGANRGKRGVTADFRTEEGCALVRELAAKADVLVENFKLGGLVKYGLDFSSLSALNPGLVYCSVTGFGQDGPRAAQAGYDFLIQGMSGIMSLNGEPEGEPQKMGVAFADIFTGLYGVIAIQAALAQRARTGLGQHIDMSLMDCMTGVLANQAMNCMVTGEAPNRLGNAHPNIVPYQVFPAADGHLIIACGNTAQFRRLCGVLNLREIGDDPAYAENAGRVADRARLVARLAEATARFPRDALIGALGKVGVPAGPINRVDEALADPQVVARGLQIAPEGVPGLRSPVGFSAAELSLGRASPALDQHGEAIRAALARGEWPAPEPEPETERGAG